MLLTTLCYWIRSDQNVFPVHREGTGWGNTATNLNFSLPSNTKHRLASIFLQLPFIVYTRNCQPCFYGLLCWMMGRRKGLPKKKDSKRRENELDTPSYSKSISALVLSSCAVLHAALNYDTLALGEILKSSHVRHRISQTAKEWNMEPLFFTTWVFLNQV